MSLAARDHPRRMTADEFFATTDELPFSQLIDGELVVPMSAPTIRHDEIVMRLAFSHRVHAQTHADAGHMSINSSVLVDDENVFQPDLWWVPDRTVLDPEARRHPEPPPLVIEVRSATTWADDRGRKLRGYLRVGVGEVWLVDGVDRQVTVHRAGEDPVGRTDVISTPLIPGWSVDLSELFSP